MNIVEIIRAWAAFLTTAGHDSRAVRALVAPGVNQRERRVRLVCLRRLRSTPIQRRRLRRGGFRRIRRVRRIRAQPALRLRRKLGLKLRGVLRPRAVNRAVLLRGFLRLRERRISPGLRRFLMRRRLGGLIRLRSGSVSRLLSVGRRAIKGDFSCIRMRRKRGRRCGRRCGFCTQGVPGSRALAPHRTLSARRTLRAALRGLFAHRLIRRLGGVLHDHRLSTRWHAEAKSLRPRYSITSRPPM